MTEDMEFEMPSQNQFDMLFGVIAENTKAIAENTKAIAKNTKAIAETNIVVDKNARDIAVLTDAISGVFKLLKMHMDDDKRHNTENE